MDGIWSKIIKNPNYLTFNMFLRYVMDCWFQILAPAWLKLLIIALVLDFDSTSIWLLFLRLYFSFSKILKMLEIFSGCSCLNTLVTSFLICCSLHSSRVFHSNLFKISCDQTSYVSPDITLAALFWRVNMFWLIPYLGACYIHTKVTKCIREKIPLYFCGWTIKSHSPGYEIGPINRSV